MNDCHVMMTRRRCVTFQDVPLSIVSNPQVWAYIPSFLPSFLPLATMAEKDTTARLRRAVKGSFAALPDSPVAFHLMSYEFFLQKITCFLSNDSLHGRKCEIPTLGRDVIPRWPGLLYLGTRRHSSSCCQMVTMTMNVARCV